MFIIIAASPWDLVAKPQKIKLTGTCNEKIVVSIGETGRKEVISALPYILEVDKNDLPLRLKFSSDNFIYYDIDIPKKPFDTTGHVYLVKINENFMPLYGRESNQSNNQMMPAPVNSDSNTYEGIDKSRGINKAPVTNLKANKTLALIISNENYEIAANVENATNDGLAFKEYCLCTLGIPQENIIHATNLSYGRMKKAIKDILGIADMMSGEANLIIYYAGHGIPDNNTKDAFLMPIDADGTDTEVCLSLNSLYSNINNCDLNLCIVFLDACFSGAQRGGDMIVAARGVKLKPKETAPNGKTIVFSATSGDEAAFSHKEEEHGLFTYFLLKKLQDSKGKTTLGELAEYIKENVGLESRRINKAAQTPTIIVSSALESSWKRLTLTK
ncbi:MAG: caspase family protein [Muribaculaceae bacterium]|nr:caspase family protein [Muribaculaceae bacterium]